MIRLIGVAATILTGENPASRICPQLGPTRLVSEAELSISQHEQGQGVVPGQLLAVVGGSFPDGW